MVEAGVKRTALVTGVGGQDGVLAARRLVAEGWRVVGTTKPGAPDWAAPYLNGVEQVPLDLRDRETIDQLVREVRPDEVYHFAAVSTVRGGWADPDGVAQINTTAVADLLTATARWSPACRVFLASSSEVFGPEATNPQTESTPLAPANPYAESKAAVHRLAADARDAGRFVAVGILYNHESPIRPTAFVTRKITRAAAEIAARRQEVMTLGNMHTSRDWSAASDVIDAAVRMVRADQPRDYVVASGQLHTIGQLVEAAFAAAGVDDPWSHIEQDPALIRSGDPAGLCGDATALRTDLGWTPTTSFDELITSMVRADQRRLESGIEEDPVYLT